MKIIGGHSCFYIDPDTGYIHVRANLQRSPCTSNIYSFEVIAQDGNSPPRQSNQVTVTMYIIRNRTPRITNLPGNVTIGQFNVSSLSLCLLLLLQQCILLVILTHNSRVVFVLFIVIR